MKQKYWNNSSQNQIWMTENMKKICWFRPLSVQFIILMCSLLALTQTFRPVPVPPPPKSVPGTAAPAVDGLHINVGCG